MKIRLHFWSTFEFQITQPVLLNHPPVSTVLQHLTESVCTVLKLKINLAASSGEILFIYSVTPINHSNKCDWIQGMKLNAKYNLLGDQTTIKPWADPHPCSKFLKDLFTQEVMWNTSSDVWDVFELLSTSRWILFIQYYIQGPKLTFSSSAKTATNVNFTSQIHTDKWVKVES